MTCAELALLRSVADENVGARRVTTLRSHITTEGAPMSRVRVHNFSISLDGFSTGDGLSAEAPFGHAGERLHQWMFATRFWGAISSGSAPHAAGTTGVDNAFAERHEHGIGAE